MNTATQSFTGHAKIVQNLCECKMGEHYLLYSKQFGTINEIVIEGKHGVAYPKQIYYHYAHREQHYTMNLWLHEIESENYLLFKIQ